MTRLTASFVRSILSYDPETGLFRWQRRTDVPAQWNTRYAGKLTTTSTYPNGYARLILNDHHYLAHRVAWLYMTGEWPSMGLDHINGQRLDNRWSNLRLATHSENLANKKKFNGRSQFKGVSQSSNGQRWCAFIGRGVGKYLGTFDTEEAAHAAYREAALRLYGEFARFE